MRILKQIQPQTFMADRLTKKCSALLRCKYISLKLHELQCRRAQNKSHRIKNLMHFVDTEGIQNSCNVNNAYVSRSNVHVVNRKTINFKRAQIRENNNNIQYARV